MSDDYSMRQIDFSMGGACVACLLMIGLYSWEISLPDDSFQTMPVVLAILEMFNQVPVILVPAVGAGLGFVLEENIYKKKKKVKI